MNQAIVDVLKQKGFVNNFLVNEKKYAIRIFLRYEKKSQEAVIHGLKRMSRPSIRRYVGYKDIPKVLSGLGIAILSTPSGIVDGDKARSLKVGGELLCLVW